MTALPLDVAILGAGTAGLSARAEVAKVTDSYLVFDPGPLGTSCARAACMPSKALLHSAHAFHRRDAFEAMGLRGATALEVDAPHVLAKTRALRDHFVSGAIDGMEPWRETHLAPHAAAFDAEGRLCAGGHAYAPRATIIATGSSHALPPGWRDRLGDRLLTSGDVFELADLPGRLAVIGLGPVGLELGQAMARLGVEVVAFDGSPEIGGLTDPELQGELRARLSDEMELVEAEPEPERQENGSVRMTWDGGARDVDCVLAATGRKPNLSGVNLDALGLACTQSGVPELPEGQLNPPGRSVYFAGDSGHGPALLHEASDEGRIAGYCAARGEDATFNRRVPLRLVFCEPQIAVAGGASLDETGRTKLQRGVGGAIRIYADAATARILGAAFLAPEAEHLAHLMAFAIDLEADIPTLLRMPAYHPTHEEALRRALRAALGQCAAHHDRLEAIRCEDSPVDSGTAGPAM